MRVVRVLPLTDSTEPAVGGITPLVHRGLPPTRPHPLGDRGRGLQGGQQTHLCQLKLSANKQTKKLKKRTYHKKRVLITNRVCIIRMQLLVHVHDGTLEGH